jgi:thiol-disulfide isomerase/thioredoxin
LLGCGGKSGQLTRRAILRFAFWETIMTGSVLSAVLAAALFPAPLTIGSPAPKIAPLTFVRGDPVKELSKGTIYVIEFSGVECVPCHEVIRLLTKLQKTHPKVILISVYSDDEKIVREYLADKGKGADYRVAVDSPGAMWKTWSAAALQGGIPTAFVVDAAGKVAWIGNPADLADPLGQIVAGTFDSRADMMRLHFEQGLVRRERGLQEQERQIVAEHKRVNELESAGKVSDALAATDRALARFAGWPRANSLFRSKKLYLLAKLPGRKEEVVALATDLAIDARLSGQWMELTSTGTDLLNLVERVTPKDPDRRLVDLAVALLAGQEPNDLRWKPAGEAQKARASILYLQGRAHHLRGDHRKAVAALQDALAVAEKLKPDPGVNEKDFAAEQKQMADYFRELLAEYRRAADARPK